jgi:uncharacterized protein YjbI with pentapeptide repeats
MPASPETHVIPSRESAQNAVGVVAAGAYQDLARKDFSRADLRGQTFVGAQLQYANFCGANLRGVNFCSVDARGALFDRADLTQADFTEALLQGASFRHARLVRTAFRQALLISAHLEQAFVQETDFAGANLEWAWVAGLTFHTAIVWCAVLLNVRGLSDQAREVVEAQGGFTGRRTMILGRELYDTP